MKIVVDTNIIFSALLNSDSRIARILLDSRERLDFYSCRYLQTELQRHLPKLQRYSRMPEEQLLELIILIESRIFFIDETLLPNSIIAEAKRLVWDVDFNDFAFIAIANYMDATLWTGDKVLLAGLRQKGYRKTITSQELIYYLDTDMV